MSCKDFLQPLCDPLHGSSSPLKITSQSLEGVSLVIVEFDLARDADVASQDIRSKIETIRRDLPTDIDPPIGPLGPLNQVDFGALYRDLKARLPQ